MRILVSREKLILMGALELNKRDIEWKAKRCYATKGKLTPAQKDRIGHISRLSHLVRDGKMGIID